MVRPQVIINKKLVKRLLNITLLDNMQPGVKLSKKAAALFEHLTSLLPLKLANVKSKKLHYTCWFLCCIFNSKYVHICKKIGKFDCYQLETLEKSLDLLKYFCDEIHWCEYSWSCETYWLLKYFYEITKYKDLADIFCCGGGVARITRLLDSYLVLTDYDIDIFEDEMIIVMILKNIADSDPLICYDDQIVPLFLKYLKTMQRHFFVLSSHYDAQRAILTAILSILISLSTRIHAAFQQVIDNEGLKILGGFIGCHPDTDRILNGYFSIVNKFRYIERKIHDLNKYLLIDSNKKQD